jgi:hypothetical protein
MKAAKLILALAVVGLFATPARAQSVMTAIATPTPTSTATPTSLGSPTYTPTPTAVPTATPTPVGPDANLSVLEPAVPIPTPAAVAACTLSLGYSGISPLTGGTLNVPVGTVLTVGVSVPAAAVAAISINSNPHPEVVSSSTLTVNTPGEWIFQERTPNCPTNTIIVNAY